MVHVVMEKLQLDVAHPKRHMLDIHFERPFHDGTGPFEIMIMVDFPLGIAHPLAEIEAVFVELLLELSSFRKLVRSELLEILDGLLWSLVC